MDPVMQTLDINRLFSFLGSPIGDEYESGKHCMATLETILSRLYNEDKYVRSFRRLIANSQVLKRDLLPLLYSVKSDHKMLDLIIEILENLMIPVECLLPIEQMIKEEAGRSTIYQLNWLLTACKEAFLNPCATKSIINYMKVIIKKEQQLTTEGSKSISLCLLLLRNLLHIPEVRGGAPGGGATHQNQIIWNLFTHNIDKVLFQLMTCSQHRLWASTIVQVIALMYKDQQSFTICKLLNIWCDTALTESSEDDESNTSPQDQESGDSSDMISDFSDCDQQKHMTKTDTDLEHESHSKQAAQTRMTEMLAHGKDRKAQVAMRNKHGNSKNTHPAKHRQPDPIHPLTSQFTSKVAQGVTRVCWGSESGLGSSICTNGSVKMEEESEECGYVSQNPDTVFSNEDKELPEFRFRKRKIILRKIPLKIQNIRSNNVKLPLTCQTRKELCRQKLMKRSKATSIKTFLNHMPSEEDISNLLKEFTLDFLLKGYGRLLSDLKSEVLSTQEVQMDTSHFTWLIMYFLPFAKQLEVDLNLISSVLSHDIVSYLTYEGITLFEELEMAKLGVRGKPIAIFSKLFLSVSCLKEIVVTIEEYRKFTHLTEAEQEYLKQLQEKICHTNDLKYLLVLLLQHFDPMFHSQEFLQEMVVANHTLLVLMENCPSVSKNVILEHLRQFANEEMMMHYGVLLACCKDNGELVNNCIFTMMHHVAGDLEKVSALFQPTIVKAFTSILETKVETRDEWTDLIQYVIQKFLKKQAKTELDKLVTEDEAMVTEVAHCEVAPQPRLQPPALEWSKGDLENLCWYFTQSQNQDDSIGHVKQLFLENSGRTITRTVIIENLWKQGFLEEEKYKTLLEKEMSLKNSEVVHSNSTEVNIFEGIQAIIDYLNTENKGFFVKWLQGCLLDVCYVKLVMEGRLTPQPHQPVEPVAYYTTMLGLPVPLVTWNQELWKVMQQEPCIWLLSALNFQLPTNGDQARVFPRIPSEWSIDHLCLVTLILGPFLSSSLKFDPMILPVMNQICQSPNPSEQSSATELNLHSNPSLSTLFQSTALMSDWQLKVSKLKTLPKVQPLEEKHERMSVNSGDEGDWDLISICVSDEGARHDDPTSTH